MLDAILTLLVSALLGPNNPVCSRPCTEVSGLRASTICTLSLLDSEHCGGALLEAIESDLIPALAFCQQRLYSDERNGSSGQTNLLLYVSHGQIEYVQDGLELCFSCQKQVWVTAGPATTPPEWSFISSQHCHKVNTSSAIALCFLACLAAHSDVPCPLVLCPTPFSESAPHSALISHFLMQACLRPCRESTAWCEVRCYLSQPSARGVDICTGILLCHCNWLSLSFWGHQQI